MCGTVKHLGNGDCISLFKVLHHKRNYGQSDVFDVIQLLLAKSCQLTIFNKVFRRHGLTMFKGILKRG